MISRDRFMQLKAGDVVLWGKRRQPRIVHEGPRDVQGGRHVTFAIRRRSWTGRVTTVYLWNDVKRILSLPRRPLNLRSLCAAERSHLASIGFDVAAGIRREIDDHERMRARSDWFASTRSTRPLRRMKLALVRTKEAAP